MRSIGPKGSHYERLRNSVVINVHIRGTKERRNTQSALVMGARVLPADLLLNVGYETFQGRYILVELRSSRMSKSLREDWDAGETILGVALTFAQI
jgi:hypothetical protein